jgi:hypothetical protein
MSTEPIPDTTAIKRSKVGNIDTDRLARRQQRLDKDIRLSEAQFGTRIKFAYRMAELDAVEKELEQRGEEFARSPLTPRPLYTVEHPKYSEPIQLTESDGTTVIHPNNRTPEA